MQAASPSETQRRLVWIVDDSPLESEMSRRALSGDYEVAVFQDGTTVLEALADRAPPDVVVLDWLMPGVSGIEVIHFLRQSPQTAELAILLLTVHRETGQIVEGLQAGANDFLAKPYAAPELVARVAALVRSRVLRERAEKAELTLRKVVAHLPDAVLTVDRNGQVVFANREAENVFARPLAELAGLRLDDLLPGLDLRRANAEGRYLELPDVSVGEQVFAPRVSIPPADDDGNTTTALRNVTDTRHAATRRLDFYSMAAHDLRSPLSALQMRAHLIKQGLRGPITAQTAAELARMEAGFAELIQMISDFLDIAQMEASAFHLERTSLDLCAVLQESVEAFRPLADAKALSLAAPAALEPALVIGDQRRLTQVLANLLSNAIKFTPSGGLVTARVALEPEAVEVTVADTGRGIPEVSVAKLFRRYSRIAEAGGATEGSGLGLMIVREIVEAHGGSVGVRGAIGGGSAFWFRLPRAQPAPALARVP
ncbi:MAG: response regulator [Myxococcales bacterium]